VEVPLKSALILVSLESPCEIRATHPVVLGERLLIITEAVSVMIEPMIGVFKEVSITHSSRVNTIIYPKCSSNFSHLTFCPASGLRASDVASTNVSGFIESVCKVPITAFRRKVVWAVESPEFFMFSPQRAI